MEVLAVFRDANAHCVIRVDITTAHTYFIENTGSEYAVNKLKTQEFNQRFAVMENYEVKKAAAKYLSNRFITHTSAALTLLNNILKEDDMSQTKTFRAPVATGAKTLPAKTEPAKTEPAKTAAKEIAADPKKVENKVTAAKKIAAESKKAEPAKKEAPAKKTAKAAPKKAAAKKPAAKKAEPAAKAGRRGTFSDESAVLKIVKKIPDSLKVTKRAQLIYNLIEAKGKELSVGNVVKGIQREMEKLDQVGSPAAILSVHGGFLLSEGIIKLG